jgi:hypothetical protein
VLRKHLHALPQPLPYSDEQLRDIELWPTSFAHFVAGSESAYIPDRVFFTFSRLAQTDLRNFMAPVLATERCAFTTRLRLTGVRPNSLANRTALS